jgi:hypothetical protein
MKRSKPCQLSICSCCLHWAQQFAGLWMQLRSYKQEQEGSPPGYICNNGQLIYDSRLLRLTWTTCQVDYVHLGQHSRQTSHQLGETGQSSEPR